MTDLTALSESEPLGLPPIVDEFRELALYGADVVPESWARILDMIQELALPIIDTSVLDTISRIPIPTVNIDPALLDVLGKMEIAAPGIDPQILESIARLTDFGAMPVVDARLLDSLSATARHVSVLAQDAVASTLPAARAIQAAIDAMPPEIFSKSPAFFAGQSWMKSAATVAAAIQAAVSVVPESKLVEVRTALASLDKGPSGAAFAASNAARDRLRDIGVVPPPSPRDAPFMRAVAPLVPPSIEVERHEITELATSAFMERQERMVSLLEQIEARGARDERNQSHARVVGALLTGIGVVFGALVSALIALFV